MPSSGSVDYTCNALDIVTIGYRNIGLLGEGRVLSPYRINVGMSTLNMLVKQLSGQSDFSPGIKMWSRKRAFIFLQQNQNSYSLPSDKSATSYNRTTLAVNAANGASTITVAATTGFATTNKIGIVLDSGAIFWTTENGAPSGSVITLTDVTTGAAASGNTVFVYSQAMRRPLSILTANLRNTDGDDTALGVMDLYGYESIGSKFDTSQPVKAYYEAQLTNGVLYLNSYPDDVTNVIEIVYLSPIEDLDSTTDTIDYPQSWFRYLGLQLGADLGIIYQRPMSPEYKVLLDESRAIAKNDIADTTEIYFQPNAD